MKVFKCLLIAAVLVTGNALLYADQTSQKLDKVKENVAASHKQSDTLSLNTSNIIVVADTKDLDKLIKALGKDKKTEAAPQPVKSGKFRIWPAIKSEIQQMWAKINELKILTFENLYILVGGLFLTLLSVHILRWIIEKIIVKCIVSKTKSNLDNMIIEALNPPVETVIYTIGIYLSLLKMLMQLPDNVFNICSRVALALIAGIVAWAFYRLVSVLTEQLSLYTQKTQSKFDDLLVILLRKTLKITIVVVSALLIGQNILGVNITTLLAGAGIFGLAIAFAAQDTIANFFGSIMIVLDKPFYVGERINVGGISGVVKSVGFRTTRLETMDGHIITMPNKKLTESPIENIAQRPFIKFTINLTLVYETTPDQMREAIKILHEIFDNHEGMDAEKQPKIFFNQFNDWSLNLLVIVWYHPGDWALANTWMSERNLDILQRFNDAGLGFAFPSNTTYLVNGDEKLEISMKQEVN